MMVTQRRTTPGADLALAGLPQAQRLCQDVSTCPDAAMRVAVIGPGGSGKSALLDALAVRYQQADVTVLQGPLPNVDPAGVAVLVDDAHLLDATDLDSLRDLAANPAARLVLAYRPWHRSPQLSALIGLLGRGRPPVVLGHLDQTGVAARASAILGRTVSDEFASLLWEHTGGLPAFVDQLVPALPDDCGTIEMPPSVVERFQADLWRLEPLVHDVLLAVALDAELDVEALAELFGVEFDVAADAVDGTLSTGWLTGDGTLVALARQAILRLTPGARARAVRQRLARIQLGRRGSLLAAGCRLLDSGAIGSSVAAVLESAADEAMGESSSLATKLFTAAANAGAPPLPMAARRAEAAALAGDLDAALRFADQVVAEPLAPDRTRGALVAAAVLAHRGLLARSAELYRWLEATTPDGTTAVSVPALIGTGDLGQAQSVLATANTGALPPTIRAGAESMMARGIHETIAGSPAAALSQLAGAAALLEPSGRTALLPDTPAALAAVAALQCGELAVADSVLTRAVASGLGGCAADIRHQLLRAWIVMLRGDLPLARTLLDRAAPRGRRLEARDELVATALDVGIARRGGDLPSLWSAWARAREAVIRYPVDLYTLQPLGELAVAAARLGEQTWLTPHLRKAQALLDRLGRPVLWAAPLHWFGVQAAIAAESPPEANEHAMALVTVARESPYAAALAAASQCWLRVLGGDIDAESVASVARRLQAVGLPWDGARLAAQAAIRTTDRAAMSMLLGCARSVNTVAAKESPPPADDSGETVHRLLSPREVEVAQLVLVGLTYKQVGERLFITAKTVEHHVARMRGRLGCATRGELLGRLRLLLADHNGGSARQVHQ